ncbi:hypothetical protein [Terrarubrum flagellatum]|uniref:hypothetical protein n=1 Tax=Terrirubrum flagellatum TaxID=2895980 RepID=UPI003144E63A
MGFLSLAHMEAYLSKSLTSLNQNKLNGLRAEIDFRTLIAKLGFERRVSAGGWLLRNTRGNFGHHIVAVFPHVIEPNRDYSGTPTTSNIPTNLHTICATFNQLGIKSYYAHPIIDSAGAIEWKFVRLGVPHIDSFVSATDLIAGFHKRPRHYNFLRYQTDASQIDRVHLPDEFSKENLRIFLSSLIMCEIVDIDGIIWGERHTYPIEIKEKTAAPDPNMGEFFGLDVGPFVKLAFYAAKKEIFTPCLS